MSIGRATVAGAGLAGLAAAVALREVGVEVSLSDSAAQAGGRCRSYHDPALDMTIDNGNPLVLAGHPAVAHFRRACGAPEPLAGPDHADFAFADLRSGARWTVRINDGRLPWWVLSGQRRVPGTRTSEYLALGRLLRAGSVPIRAAVAASGPLWDRFVDPVMLAVLNTPVAESSAALAAQVLRETLGRGGLATRPRIAQPTLGAAFVDPALAWLAERGTALATGRRLRGMEFGDDHVSALVWSDGTQPIAPDEAVILAVPAWVAQGLVPATPEQDALRPGPRTRWRNLFLAGDWVRNGLPATIEGALRSGDGAARLALGRPLRYGLPRC